MESLSSSSGDLASRSSLTPSEVSSASISDLTLSNENVNDGQSNEDDQAIENKIKTISASSFSNEVLNCIPTIKITSYKRMLSDLTNHESENLLTSPAAASEAHSLCSADQAAEETSTHSPI